MHKKLVISFCLVLFALVFSLIPINSVQAENTFVFNNNLKAGDIHSDVKELQKFFNAHNFVLANSGPGSLGNETTKFGALTKSTLIKFQLANNITPAVGYFGPITRGVINKINGSNLSSNFAAGCSVGNLFSSTTGFSCTTGLPVFPFHVARGGSGSTGGGNHNITQSSDATLSLASTIKGESLLTFGLGTPSETLLEIGMPVFAILTNTQATDITNAGNFITSFVPTNSRATTKVVMYSFPLADLDPITTFETDAEYNGTDPISSGGIFVVKVTAENGSALYYVFFVGVLAEGTADAVAGESTITYTLTAGVFDTVEGIDINSWNLGGADLADLGSITDVTLSAGDTVATITIDGVVGAVGSDYTVEPEEWVFPSIFSEGVFAGFFTAPLLPETVNVTPSVSTADVDFTLTTPALGGGNAIVVDQTLGNVVPDNKSVMVDVENGTESVVITATKTADQRITVVDYDVPPDDSLNVISVGGNTTDLNPTFTVDTTAPGDNVSQSGGNKTFLFIVSEAGKTDITYYVNIQVAMPVVSATLDTPQEYDLFVPNDVTSEVTLNDATSITEITNVAVPLMETVDYTFVAGTLTINESYLTGLPVIEGVPVVLTVVFDVGDPAVLTIDIVDSALEDVTSAVFTTTVATTTITITLAEGSFKAAPIVAADFIFGGPNGAGIAADGIFDRTDATHVAITGLGVYFLARNTTDNDNTVTVLGETQTAQVITVGAVSS